MIAHPLFIYTMVYFVPAFILFTMANMVFGKNVNKSENRLVAILIFLCSVLYSEEYIRHLLPINYSSMLTFLVLFNVGMLIYSVLGHFYFNITNLYKRVRIPFYPLIFYIPTIVVVLLQVVTNTYDVNIQFNRSGLWLVPEMGFAHYLFITLTSLYLLFLIGVLRNGLKHATSRIKSKLIQWLMVGTFIGFLLNVFLGYRQFEGVYPPFLSILSGILLTIFLGIGIYKFQLLPPALERYQKMFHLSPLPIMVLDEGWGLLEYNKEAEKDILYYGNKQSTLMELAFSEFNQKELFKLFNQMRREKELLDYSITFQRFKTSEVLHFSVDTTVVVIEDKTVYYTIWRNVTEELKKERIIERMAYRDALTSLHNRAYFVKEIESELTEKLQGKQVNPAVVLIDLNRFKQINDTYGHAIGDKVLQKTAEILTNLVGPNDLVARIGGDEFIIYLSTFPNKKAVLDWEESVREAFKQNRFNSQAIDIEIGISIGIAYYPEDGNDFESLYHVADVKMYEDKKLSRAREKVQ